MIMNIPMVWICAFHKCNTTLTNRITEALRQCVDYILICSKVFVFVTIFSMQSLYFDANAIHEFIELIIHSVEYLGRIVELVHGVCKSAIWKANFGHGLCERRCGMLRV